MKIVAGGTEYQLAPLKWADMRDLGKGGHLKRMANMAALEEWELRDTLMAVVTCSARRAGSQVTQRDLEEAADQDMAPFVAAIEEIAVASGLVRAGGGSPNAESPGTGT